MSRRATLTLASLLALAPSVSLVGCGAKSGLEVPPPGASARDASIALDASTPGDGSIDASACRLDADCDDGLACSDDRCIDGACQHTYLSDRCDDRFFCNGLERCEPGVGCVSPGRACDDGVACTVDECSESLRRCVSRPEDFFCPLSFRCDAERGCTARALVHDERSLYELDLPGGELHDLGRFPVNLTDVALAPDGTLYGASSEIGALVRVDYHAVTYERVMRVGGAFNALDVAPDGRLFGAADDHVYLFDLARGEALEIATLPSGYISSGDIAFVDGELYVAGTERTLSGPSDVLFHVDIHGGVGEAVGTIGYPCVWGLAPFGARLYGVTCEGLLLELDLSTGAATFLASNPGHRFWGAASR